MGWRCDFEDYMQNKLDFLYIFIGAWKERYVEKKPDAGTFIARDPKIAATSMTEWKYTSTKYNGSGISKDWVAT